LYHRDSLYHPVAGATNRTPERIQVTQSVEHFDVVIVGAGLSGVGAACQLSTKCRGTTFAILEARSTIGGTWDLFRYPGVRSDSDMYTLGYSFRPWTGDKALADGASIREYVRETAREFGVDRAIQYDRRVRCASWSSVDARWTVETQSADGTTARYTCGFLYLCSGYYDYAAGYAPTWPGMEHYAGRLVHPQHWPADLDHAGKRVVVIGSGATAVTLVPAMAATATHVTMLQRSPSYVLSLPETDVIAGKLRRWLPARLAYRLTRWKNVGFSMGFYGLCRVAPATARRLLRSGVVRALGPGFDVDTHFNPRYEPWDQRLCFVPANDLFKAIRSGRASVETDRIRSFDARGIALESGKHLDADVIVSATGLELKPLGGIELAIDGASVPVAGRLTYRGVMLDGVPNLAFCVGYTNASWTLRADLVSSFVCRLLNHMKRHGHAHVRPHNTDAAPPRRPLLGLTSGYVQRGSNALPAQGMRSPWTLHQNHVREWLSLRLGGLDDGALRFGGDRGDAAATSTGAVALEATGRS
jgi:monooxygenase